MALPQHVIFLIGGNKDMNVLRKQKELKTFLVVNFSMDHSQLFAMSYARCREDIETANQWRQFINPRSIFQTCFSPEFLWTSKGLCWGFLHGIMFLSLTKRYRWSTVVRNMLCGLRNPTMLEWGKRYGKKWEIHLKGLIEDAFLHSK